TVATNDVGVGNEIEWRIRVEPRLAIEPAFRDVEWGLVVVLSTALIKAGDVGLRRNLFAAFFVTAHRPVADSKRERRVRIIARAFERKPRFRDFGVGLLFD